jgi:flavin reductase (DIM6/NTAB) family NADH-FMN oxidoreductase RutF
MILMSDTLDNIHRYFATTVSLVTTKGKHGPNVMAAEWTMQVSYEPMLIAIFIHESPTYWNIEETRIFGVNIASDDQAELVNIAGGYSGTEIEKLAIPGIFATYRAKQIDVPMVKGCVLNAECKVTSIQKIGDHIMVVGEAVRAKFDAKKLPFVYTRGNYRKISKSKIPSGRKIVHVTSEQMSEFKKMSSGQFVLKTAVAIIKKGNKTLLQKFGGRWTPPMVLVSKGADYKNTLNQHIHSIGVAAGVGQIKGIWRVVLKSRKEELRANFILFDITLNLFQEDYDKASWFTKPPKNTLLKSLL